MKKCNECGNWFKGSELKLHNGVCNECYVIVHEWNGEHDALKSYLGLRKEDLKKIIDYEKSNSFFDV